MADMVFREYEESDWLWDYLDRTGTPYMYSPDRKKYTVFASEEKHNYIHDQLLLMKRKGVRLVE